MRMVRARDANEGFSKLLDEVAGGEEIVVMRHGRPIATLAPYRAELDERERLAAIERLEAFFKEGPARVKARRFAREEMHER